MPSERSSSPGALENYRVLDLSRVFSGPWAAQMLGDLGAEVIKVERPGSGDDSRRLGPYFAHPERDSAESVFFASANRNKKSITVDISSEDGQALIRAMAAKSDVLIENYKSARFGDTASITRRSQASTLRWSIVRSRALARPDHSAGVRATTLCSRRCPD